MIKQGLFPSPGANVSTKKGGGKGKTDHQWAMCKVMFTNHETYGAAFAKVKTPKAKAAWALKIKNRLQT
jgi:hypothetical protein